MPVNYLKLPITLIEGNISSLEELIQGHKLTIVVNISILSNKAKFTELINLHDDYSKFGL